MALHRFFLTAALARTAPGEALLPAPGPLALPLSAADLHHAADVLRLAPGERIAVVEPDRSAWEVAIDRIDATGATGVPLAALAAPTEPHVTLVQGLAKGDKLDLVVEKAVEIGIEAIVPVAFERSVVRLDAERAAKRGDRLRRVAAAAAKQAQRTFVPHVADPLPETALLTHLAGFDLVLVAWEDAADAPGIARALADAAVTREARVALVVGPEGGLSAAEVASLTGAGAVTVSLGAFVLRTETAGIVASALVLHELGGLGASGA